MISDRSGRSVGIKILLYCDSGPELNKLFIFQRAGADFVVCKSHLSFSLCLEYLVGISPRGEEKVGRDKVFSPVLLEVWWSGLFQGSLCSALHY